MFGIRKLLKNNEIFQKYFLELLILRREVKFPRLKI